MKSGNSRRRSNKNRDWNAAESAGSEEERRRPERNRNQKKQTPVYERPKWVPIKLPTGPLPSAVCPICAEPIKDIIAAVSDKSTGSPAHFDCVIKRIKEQERLDRGDEIVYLGGGRFGIIQYLNHHDYRNFRVKKVLEWEDAENRAEWRKDIADRFSVY